MAFVRSFDISKIDKLTEKWAGLFARLKADIYAGVVFPAVRKGAVDFYYKGGLLYRFNGSSFKRNPDYEKEVYASGTEELDDYEKAKKQCENKFAGIGGAAKERQLLDRLNRHTFNPNRNSKVVVLDIEVRLGGVIGGTKKCDMVLLNVETGQIMFVEGKVFKDSRVNVAVGFMPEVIEQVDIYTAGVAEQATEIAEQYAQHIQVINTLFETEFSTALTLMPKAKLLVYETSKMPTVNGRHSINLISNALGADSVLWVMAGQEPTLDEIWEVLCK